jgi:2-oxoglutarate dehydrogenase E2 component (dihydrolipoamide succinyltransferase)
MATNVSVPPLGESISEATLIRWLKEEGDAVAVDEPICELETDKATVALPSPAAGTLKQLKKQGEIIQIGDVVASVGEMQTGESAPVTPERAAPAKDVTPTKNPESRAEVSAAPTKPSATSVAPPPKPKSNPAHDGPGVRREPMSKIRLRIAQRLVSVKQDTAMLTTFNEVDMSAVQDLRARLKEDFEKTHGVPLGLMSFFARACILALDEFPVLNASIDGSDICYHDYVNLGVAVSTERGLVVPVLNHAEKMGFAKIESEIRRMAGSAREGRLEVSEMGGGTFTITNGGVFGSLLSTPILNSPQSGILGMHTIQKRPKAMPDDSVKVRPMMYLALSYDHRVVDGKDSVRFLVKVKEWIEDPEKMLLKL